MGPYGIGRVCLSETLWQGKSHGQAYPMLGTTQYEFHFDFGEMIELMANAIADAICQVS